MIALGKKATPVPPITPGVVVPQGAVFVAAKDGSGQLEGGQRAVLSTKGGSLELVTMSSLRGTITAEGSYLNQADIDRLGGEEESPTLRKYRLQDTLGKAFSGSGLILLIVTFLGLLAAGAGLYFALAGESATNAAAISERSQALITWAVEPVDRLEGSDPANAGAVRRELHGREAMARTCLKSLAGGEKSEATVGSVSCNAKNPPWWRDKDKGPLLGVAIGFLLTLLGLFGVGEKFGFGKSPAG